MSQGELRLSRKVAVITGAARGIGNALAAAFAEQGATVVLADLGTAEDGSGSSDSPVLDATNALKAAGFSAMAKPVDVTNREAIGDLVEDVYRELDRIDIVVNAAGNMMLAPLADVTLEDWTRTLDIHVTGAFNVCQIVARKWESQSRGGSVINIASDAGFTGEASAIAYSTAKAGVVGLTMSLAQFLPDFGGNANVLVPQASTRLTDLIPLEERPDSARWGSGEFEPGNVAPAAIYLASDEGRKVNGQIVGGFGFEVHRYSQPERVRSLYSDGAWELDRLFPKMGELFDLS